MKVTYLGTTMLLFDDGTDQILFDCHVTRPGLSHMIFGKLATNKEIADRVIKEFGITRLSAIFISHSHYDHVLDMPYFAEKCQSDVYGSTSTLNVARGGGISEDKLHSFGILHHKVGNFSIDVIPSIHSKAHWYNNDLGQTIDKPLKQPAGKNAYKEGGSYDFLITNKNKKYLIHPSYNFIEGQLDDVEADTLFLGITGLARDTAKRKDTFFKETIDKVHPKLVIPVHWDNFFKPLYGKIEPLSGIAGAEALSLMELEEYCVKKGVRFYKQMPLTTVVV